MNLSIIDGDGDRGFTICGFVRNIQERIEAERRIRENDFRFRSIFEDLETIAVQGYLADGTTAYWNRGSELIYGYSREEAIGKPLYELIIPPAMRDGVRQAMEKMVETSVPEEAAELRLMKKDGELVTVFSNHSVVDVPEVGREVYCIDIDLTQLKRAEAELTHARDALLVNNRNLEEMLRTARELRTGADAANAAKSRFLANMSHEIRTPLNGVIGMTQILLQSEMPPEQESYVRTINNCGQTLLTLISDILDLSAIESGKLELKPDSFSIHKLIIECEEMLSASAAGNHLDFVHEIDPALPQTMVGDRKRLKQIFVNLLSNAAKFTPEHGKSVVTRVRLSESREESLTLHCEVVDEGIGISKERQNEIFQPFHQLDSSTTRSYEGSGLGLSIVTSLVGMMDGSISVQSTPGEGSTFSFTVSLQRAGSASGGANPPVPFSSDRMESAISERPTKNPVTVLLVEDNPANLEVGRAFLQQVGCLVEVAHSGQEALDKLAQTKCDLCLMDLHMSGMDGLTATREIRSGKSGSENANLPIIALTARAMPEDRQACTEAGMNDYLSKPIQWKQFQEVIQRWIA
jgi:PAS domain S-box-containing protein